MQVNALTAFPVKTRNTSGITAVRPYSPESSLRFGMDNGRFGGAKSLLGGGVRKLALGALILVGGAVGGIFSPNAKDLYQTHISKYDVENVPGEPGSIRFSTYRSVNIPDNNNTGKLSPIRFKVVGKLDGTKLDADTKALWGGDNRTLINTIGDKYFDPYVKRVIEQVLKENPALAQNNEQFQKQVIGVLKGEIELKSAEAANGRTSARERTGSLIESLQRDELKKWGLTITNVEY